MWDRLSGWLRGLDRFETVRLLKQAGREWYDDKTFRLGAALAYYAVFSIAPVVFIAVAVAGLVLGPQAARGQIVAQLEATVGPTVARAIEGLLASAYTSGSGTLATVVGVVLLVFAATGIFTQLQDALDTIWDVKPKPGRGVWGVVKDRFWSFVAVAGTGALLLAAVMANTALAAVGRFFGTSALAANLHVWALLNLAVSWFFLTLLFAFIYRVLPDADIDWREVWVGAGLTAVLFIVGNYLIGLYLGRAGVTSAYGAAGSVVVILLWVYYSSQILLFGAEFTRVYACRAGKVVRPTPNALPVTGEERARQGMPA